MASETHEQLLRRLRKMGEAEARFELRKRELAVAKAYTEAALSDVSAHLQHMANTCCEPTMLRAYAANLTEGLKPLWVELDTYNRKRFVADLFSFDALGDL